MIQPHPRTRPFRASHRLLKTTTLTLVLAFPLGWGGCIFSPAKGKGKIQLPVYEANKFPEAVLRNLAKAYTNRDSTEYKSLFDLNYEGTSIDQFDTTPQLLTLRWADEESHIRALARSTVSSINLQLSGRLQPFHDGGDPEGWATIQDPFFTFKIYDQNYEYIIVPQSAPAVNRITMKFIPSATSPTDTTWKIIRLQEVRDRS